MTGLPVINYGRMERLKPPESTSISLNVNTFSIIFIIICILGMYNRYMTINQRRERYHT
jgi:hypothetical protein